MSAKDDIDAYTEARQKERDLQLKIDILNNQVANISAELSTARNSGNTEQQSKLENKLGDVWAEIDKLKAGKDAS